MTGKPFFFDAHIFDDEGTVQSSHPAPEKPEFTKTELLHERDKAFAEGKKSGEAAALESLNQKTLQLIQKIDRDLAILVAAEEDRNTRYEAEAVHLALSFTQKILPTLLENQGTDLLKSKITEALQNHKTPEHITIEMHPDMANNIEDHLASIEQNFQKNITMIKQSEIAPTDCNILWPEGGIIINHTKIIEESFELIKQALAEHNINGHDNLSEDHISEHNNNTNPKDNK